MSRVTVQHTRACGFCARGVRQFFQRHSLDYRAFLREGIDAESLLATGDSMAEQAVRESRRGC